MYYEVGRVSPHRYCLCRLLLALTFWTKPWICFFKSFTEINSYLDILRKKNIFMNKLPSDNSHSQTIIIFYYLWVNALRQSYRVNGSFCLISFREGWSVVAARAWHCSGVRLVKRTHNVSPAWRTTSGPSKTSQPRQCDENRHREQL